MTEKEQVYAQHYLEKELIERIQSDPEILTFLLDRVLDGAWYWDLEKPGNGWVSPGFWRTLGLDPDESEHEPTELRDLIDETDLAIALKHFQEHGADPDAPYCLITRYKGGDGGMIDVRCRGMAIRDSEGRPVRMLGANTAMTDQLAHNDRFGQCAQAVGIRSGCDPVGDYWR